MDGIGVLWKNRRCENSERTYDVLRNNPDFIVLLISVNFDT